MGCASSTEIQVDPGTGKETKRKRLGGAYPGHRPPQHQPFKPSEAAYHEGGNTATQHFVAYGGGNALTLARPDGSGLPPSQGMPQKEYIQVTLPEGVKAGDTIHVQAPSGKVNAIVIPAGFGPGSTFTVEFADEASFDNKPTHQQPAAGKYDNNNSNNYNSTDYNSSNYNYNSSNYSDNNNYNSGTYNSDNYSNNYNSTSQPSQPQSSDSHAVDDGFATGFHNPSWRPSATAVQANEPTAQGQGDNHSSSSQHYPSATATPVYYPY